MHAIRAARDARYHRLDPYDAVPAGVRASDRIAPPDRRGVLPAGGISAAVRRTTPESDRHAPCRSSASEDSGDECFPTAGHAYRLYRGVDAERPHDPYRQHSHIRINTAARNDVQDQTDEQPSYGVAWLKWATALVALTLLLLLFIKLR